MAEEIKVYTQQWGRKERIIVVCDGGSVFVDILDKPDDFGARACIWGLFVHKEHRRCGLGRKFLEIAERQTSIHGENVVYLEWESPTPQWVFDWYKRNGYDEKEFGCGYAKMYKKLNYK